MIRGAWKEAERSEWEERCGMVKEIPLIETKPIGVYIQSVFI
jgi:hypothetical protein